MLDGDAVRCPGVSHRAIRDTVRVRTGGRRESVVACRQTSGRCPASTATGSGSAGRGPTTATSRYPTATASPPWTSSSARGAERRLEGRVCGVAEQPEARLLDLRVALHRLAGRRDRHARALVDRVAVDARGDRGEGDSGAAVLGGDLDCAAVAGGEQVGLAPVAAV